MPLVNLLQWLPDPLRKPRSQRCCTFRSDGKTQRERSDLFYCKQCSIAQHTVFHAKKKEHSACTVSTTAREMRHL